MRPSGLSCASLTGDALTRISSALFDRLPSLSSRRIPCDVLFLIFSGPRAVAVSSSAAGCIFFFSFLLKSADPSSSPKSSSSSLRAGVITVELMSSCSLFKDSCRISSLRRRLSSRLIRSCSSSSSRSFFSFSLSMATASRRLAESSLASCALALRFSIKDGSPLRILSCWAFLYCSIGENCVNIIRNMSMRSTNTNTEPTFLRSRKSQ